jgi:hypothetical protein
MSCRFSDFHPRERKSPGRGFFFARAQGMMSGSQKAKVKGQKWGCSDWASATHAGVDTIPRMLGVFVDPLTP